MKSNTQNAKIEAITEKTLVLGIDVGSETHYARAFDYRGIEYSKKPFKFSNTEAGFATFKEWILELKERHEKDNKAGGTGEEPLRSDILRLRGYARRPEDSRGIQCADSRPRVDNPRRAGPLRHLRFPHQRTVIEVCHAVRILHGSDR